MLVEYSEFCEKPKEVLGRIIHHNKLGVEIEDSYRKESNHGVGGNVARYGFNGELRPENKWREESSPLYRILATLAYAPLLLWIKVAVR